MLYFAALVILCENSPVPPAPCNPIEPDTLRRGQNEYQLLPKEDDRN